MIMLRLLASSAFGQTCVQQRITCSDGVNTYNSLPMSGLVNWPSPIGNTGKFLMTDGTTYSWATPVGLGLTSGLLVMILSGTCPIGFTEVSALNGKLLKGTLSANGDVGTTGGSATLTPSGTVSTPTFTGTSNQTTSATSAGTPAGTNATGTVTPSGTLSWPAGVPTFTGSALASHSHELPFQIPSTTTTRQIAVAAFGTGTSRAATAVSATGTANTTSAAVALTQGVSAGTPSGTIAWPAGIPTFSGSSSTTSAEVFSGSAMSTHTHTLTPAGTVSQSTFTGNAVDPSPPFTKVIFCSVN